MNATWRLWGWPDACPECGDDIEVLTAAEQPPVGGPWYEDGDHWRCPEGHCGVLRCEGGPPAVVLDGA